MLRDFFSALYQDWLALVSGIASVILAIWVALFTPGTEAARKALWLTFAICLFVAAYRIWAREHRRFLEQRSKHDPIARLVEQIRPKFRSLTREQLREVRSMLPMGISAGTGENQILESVFRETALVKRVSGIGNYEIPATLKEALEVLFAEPRLDLTFNGGADDYRQSRNGSVFHQVVRLRLDNIGTNGPVEGIRVKAKEFLNLGEVPLYGTPLRISNDQSNSKREGFLINPGDTELIDVAQKTKDEDWIVLCHAMDSKFFTGTQLKELLITVFVTASTGPRLEATLWIWVNDEGLLDCEQVA